MNRLLLLAILLFPVAMLAFWIYHGTTIPRVEPPATNSITTNVIENPTNNSATNVHQN